MKQKNKVHCLNIIAATFFGFYDGSILKLETDKFIILAIAIFLYGALSHSLGTKEQK
jgi:hypothetical protein